MTNDQRKQYEDAAKNYATIESPVRNTSPMSIYRRDKIEKAYIAGCEHAHSKIEESEREAWNSAIDEVEKWALSMWERDEHSIFTELKKLRK